MKATRVTVRSKSEYNRQCCLDSHLHGNDGGKTQASYPRKRRHPGEDRRLSVCFLTGHPGEGRDPAKPASRTRNLFRSLIIFG